MENVSQYARVNNVEQCESVCGFVCVCVWLCVCVWQVKVATLHSRQRHRHHRHRSWPHVAQSIFDGRAKIYGEKYIWLCTMNPRVGKLCKSYGAPIRPTAMSTSVASPSYAAPFPLHPLPFANLCWTALSQRLPPAEVGVAIQNVLYIFMHMNNDNNNNNKSGTQYIYIVVYYFYLLRIYDARGRCCVGHCLIHLIPAHNEVQKY